MKNIFILLFILVLTFSFSSCESASDKADKSAKAILSAIEKKDDKALLELFSVEAKETAGKDDLENGVKFVFELLKGKVVSIEGGINAYSKGVGGNEYNFSHSEYIVKTDVATYILYKQEFLTFSLCKDVEGIYMLRLQPVPKTDKEKEEADEEDMKQYAGIYNNTWKNRPEHVINLVEKFKLKYDPEYIPFDPSLLQSSKSEANSN